MTTSKSLLTPTKTKAFLTKEDLQAIEQQIVRNELQAQFSGKGEPYVVVRDKLVPLFTVLELIGKA